MLAAALSHLASAAPAAPLDAANPTVFLGLLVGAILVIVQVIDKVDAFFNRRKRQPSIESEFVTKEEFREFCSRVESELRINRIAVEKLSTTIQGDFKSLYRALGKVEGVTLEDHPRG